jgi:hypothetical protein
MSKTQTIIIGPQGIVNPDTKLVVKESDLSPVQVVKVGDNYKITGIPKTHSLDLFAVDTIGEKFYIRHHPDSGTRGIDKVPYRLHIGLEGQLYVAKVVREQAYRDMGSEDIEYEMHGRLGKINLNSIAARQQDHMLPFGTDTYHGFPVKTLVDLLHKA